DCICNRLTSLPVLPSELKELMVSVTG
ncbi:hypothetical protein SEEH4588_13038, partial [Salmonella enterica subsp. enterica serovar Heidelberg str. RI-11-014588]